MQIAFLMAAGIFPANRISHRASVKVTATPDRQTGCRKECNHETSIHSRLVSHSACPPSVDHIPVRSIRAVAGALVSFPYLVSQWRRRIGFMKTSYTISLNRDAD